MKKYKHTIYKYDKLQKLIHTQKKKWELYSQGRGKGKSIASLQLFLLYSFELIFSFIDYEIDVFSFKFFNTFCNTSKTSKLTPNHSLIACRI